MSGFIKNSKILLIINPVAGKIAIKDELLNVIEVFCKHGNSVNVYTTAGKKDAELFVKKEAISYDIIICCGGDGTLNEVISGYMKFPKSSVKPLIGYIPTGTTNDLAVSLNLSFDIKTAVLDIINGECFQLDVGKFNNKFFTYSATFGIFTKTSYTTPQYLKNTFGYFAYIIEGLRDLSNIQTYQMSVRTDDNEINDDFIFGAVTNSTSIGGIINLFESDVDLSDGLFEVVLIKNPQNPIELNNLIFNISKQHFNNDRNIFFYRTSKIEFNISKPISWTIDGEFAGNYNNVKIRNIPKPITIVKSNK